MTRSISAWKVLNENTVSKLPGVHPDYEKQLESWITHDPSIVSDDLILVGRQLQTSFGTIIDLLGLNRFGDLVLIELKRNKSSRTMIAQALEYAAWASTLSYEKIIDVANDYFGSEDALAENYAEKFEQELPETLNQAQQIVLVAMEIKERTAAVIEYLSTTYEVAINAVCLSMIDVNGEMVLLRDVVVDQDGTDRPATKKRARPSTIDRLMEKSEEAGNGDIAEYFWSKRSCFKTAKPLTWSWNFQSKGTKSRRVVMSIFPFGPKYARNEIGDRFVISLMPRSLADAYGKSEQACLEFVEMCQTKYGEKVPAPKSNKLRFTIDGIENARLFFDAYCNFFDVQINGDD